MKLLFGYTMMVGLCLLVGCGASSSSEADPILVLRGPSGMSMIYLIDSTDYLNKNGLAVEILDEPNQVRARLLREEPVIAAVPMNMSAILYNLNLDYQLLAVPVWGTLYLFGRDSNVKDWSDLKGKTVNLMARGMTPDIVFRYLLEKQGLRPGIDVLLDYRFPTHIDLAQAVISGFSDLAVLSEPLITTAMQADSSIQPLLDLNEAWKSAHDDPFSIPQTALLVKTRWARGNPDKISELVRILERSVDRVNQDPIDAAERISSYRIVPDQETALQSIPRCRLDFQSAQAVREAIYTYLRVLYGYDPDAIGGTIPDERYIYSP